MPLAITREVRWINDRLRCILAYYTAWPSKRSVTTTGLRYPWRKHIWIGYGNLTWHEETRRQQINVYVEIIGKRASDTGNSMRIRVQYDARMRKVETALLIETNDEQKDSVDLDGEAAKKK